MPNPSLLRVFVDADVLYRATSASHQATASLAVLHLGQATVLEVVTARYTLEEALRNLKQRSPALAMDLLNLAKSPWRLWNRPRLLSSVALSDKPTPRTCPIWRRR